MDEHGYPILKLPPIDLANADPLMVTELLINYGFIHVTQPDNILDETQDRWKWIKMCL